MRLIAPPCWHSRTEWHILSSTIVTVPRYQWNDMQGDFCAVLLTCCVAAWTDCWLCDSVQKYCCTVTGGGGGCKFLLLRLIIFIIIIIITIFLADSLIALQKDKICPKPKLYSIYYIYCSTFIVIYHSALPKIINVSDKICLEIQSRHFMLSNFFRKSCHFLDNVEQLGRAGQGTHDNMVQKQGMLGN